MAANVPANFPGVNFKSAMAYGGRRPDPANPGLFINNPDVLYAAAGNQVFARTTGGGMLNPTSGLGSCRQASKSRACAMR